MESRSLINETVLAARNYLHSEAGSADYKKLNCSTGATKGRDHAIIAEFLDWDEHRVKEALAARDYLRSPQGQKEHGHTGVPTERPKVKKSMGAPVPPKRQCAN